MTQPDPDITALDHLLKDAASDEAHQPNTDFMARVLEDALSVQPMPHLSDQPVSWWQQLGGVIGGWQGMGGLVAATCAGFWIGVNPLGELPSQIDAFIGLETSLVQNDDSVDSNALIGFGWDVEEG